MTVEEQLAHLARHAEVHLYSWGNDYWHISIETKRENNITPFNMKWSESNKSLSLLLDAACAALDAFLTRIPAAPQIEATAAPVPLSQLLDDEIPF